jgi:hypothetical protein
MGEAKRRADVAEKSSLHIVNGGLVLEPKGAPAVITGKHRMIDFRAGVHPEALKVAIQYADSYALIEPEDAEEIAQGLLICAKQVRLLLARQRGGLVTD